MDILATKIELARLILSIENPTLIQKLSDLLRAESGDFWFDLTPEQQQDIHRAIEELDRGERVEWEAFRKKVS